MKVSVRGTHAVIVAMAAACGSDDRGARRSPVERAIDEALVARLRVPVVTRCFDFAPACEVRLPDGGRLPVSVIRRGPVWEWQLIGLVVTADQLEPYLRATVAELGAPQDVRCVPRIQRITAGDRIECGLAHGGKGFVTVRADGSTSVEVVLDAVAAAARSEPLTPARELELVRASRKLADAEETGEEEEVATPDAGELHVSPSPR